MSRWQKWGLRRKVKTGNGDAPLPGQPDGPLLRLTSPNNNSSLEGGPARPPAPPLKRRESSILSRRTSLDDAGRRQRQAYIRAQSLENVDSENLRGPFRIRLPELTWQDGFVELLGMTLKIYDCESPLLRKVLLVSDLTKRGVRLVRADPEERIIILDTGVDGIVFLQGGALPPYFGEWVDLLKRKMLLKQTASIETTPS